MTRLMMIAMFSTFTLGACARTPAPGTRPGDMTAAQHREQCLEHKKQAAKSEKRAEDLAGGKGTYTADQEAKEHENVAQQHGDAARAAGATAEDCP